ncbi:MAG: PLP-dependent aminotransferase family protein [Thiotrichales bacterium]|nr:PLP-dependent aminotransferase family protein [Thiotrichales bacterium]
MQITVNLDSHSRVSLQSQVFDSIREQILTGQLKSGMLMPSTRLMSEQLSVSRNTIIFAYQRLIDEGYLYSKKTIGTFVNPNLPDDSLLLASEPCSHHPFPGQCEGRKLTARHPVAFKGRVQNLFNPYHDQLDIDFWVGRPDPDSFPVNIWRQLTLKNLKDSGSCMTEYHDPLGIIELRKAIADHLQAARGITSRPEQIVIANGTQEALNLIARLLIKSGTRAVLECPCYQGAAYVLESYGASLHPVPVDTDGLDVTQLPDGKIGLAYVTPSHQYPMGATLPLERRVRLLDWARNTGAYIVEDDYDSDFRHQGSPLTAMAGQDQHGCVIYMGTFSKSIGAALRLGYLVIPEELVEPARIAKALMDNGHPWLDQAVLHDFIISGAYVKHLRRIRRTYLKRRDCLVETLHEYFGNVRLAGLEGGMHLLWKIPDSLPAAQEVQRIAQEAGVGVYSLPAAAAHTFGKKGYVEKSLLIGYSSTPEDQIEDGISRLHAALNS